MRALSVRSLLLGLLATLCAASLVDAAGPYQFYSVTPCRIVDTRHPSGLTGGPALASLNTRNFPVVGGPCGVPSTAKAIVLNVAIATPTNPGYLILWPYNTPQPLVSTINFDAPEPALSNGAIVPLSSDPSLQLAVYSELYGGGTVQLILDVTGYFQ